MIDCIKLSNGKKPELIQVNPEQVSVDFGRDDLGRPVSRRIGVYSVTSPGKELKYLYVSDYENPPTKSILSASVAELNPSPYES
jgi:hypothetical protein